MLAVMADYSYLYTMKNAKTSTLVPAAFFLAGCLINVIARFVGNGAVASAVKPALLPFLAVTVLAYAFSHPVNRRMLGLLVCAELFGAAGDMLLIGSSLPLFGGGILAFLIGHIFYMRLFGGLSWRGIKPAQWAICLAVMAALVAGLVWLLGIGGVMMGPMAVYGMVLMLLIFSTLCGVIRRPAAERKAWIIVLCGALLFTFSDSLIGLGTTGKELWHHDFLVMFTYLAAQALLAVGGLSLAAQNKE